MGRPPWVRHGQQGLRFFMMSIRPDKRREPNYSRMTRSPPVTSHVSPSNRRHFLGHWNVQCNGRTCRQGGFPKVSGLRQVRSQGSRLKDAGRNTPGDDMTFRRNVTTRKGAPFSESPLGVTVWNRSSGDRFSAVQRPGEEGGSISTVHQQAVERDEPECGATDTAMARQHSRAFQSTDD